MGSQFSPECLTLERQRQILILNDTLHIHGTMRVNYTTYDNRRSQDTINASTRPYILLHESQSESTTATCSSASEHPYRYADVQAVFHVRYIDMAFSSSKAVRMDILWVRWLFLDDTVPAGFKARRLYQVGYADVNDDDAFGFVDPNAVVRGVHIIPNFVMGMSEPENEDCEDHLRYYVNMWVIVYMNPSQSLTYLLQVCRP